MIRLALIVCLLMATVSAEAANIQEVRSPHGIRAWLVRDNKLPLISMHFAFRGGVEQDPADKQGLANLTTELMGEGAGSYDAASFQQELADHSIQLDFEAGRDSITGSIKTLSSEKQTAFDLLRLALTKPRFDTADIERLRRQQLTAIRAQFSNPGWQARVALFQKVFADHPYGERRLGSLQTLQAITRPDIKKFAMTHLAQDNLLIAVAGDISAQELALLLDQVFGDLPKHAKLSAIPDITGDIEPAVLEAPREGTQTQLLFSMPGPKRDDPDWYAAEIANYIIGGGGFSSRLMQDVRDKKGLTYGIHTGLSPMEHGALIVGEAAADNAKAGQAWDTVIDTMSHFYHHGATDKEIAAAKDYLTGSLALTMTSTDRITSVLLEMQLDRLEINYLDRRNDLIRNVTSDDIDRVIQRWFNPDKITLSMVGKPDGITPTQTHDLVRD